jgi:Tfp pilus assembly protein PilN
MKTSVKIFHWLPRILCILAIVFLSMFALDAFDPRLTIWQQLLGFVIHMIPSFILIALLIVAWKWELAGGIIFILIGLAFLPFIFTHNYAMNHSVWISLMVISLINLPFVVVGILFLISWHLKKKNPK